MVFQWLYCDDGSKKIDENGRNEWFYNILERNLVPYFMTWVTFHLFTFFIQILEIEKNIRMYIMYMKIGYIIRIVNQNNQNMIKFQNHKNLYNKYPGIVCVIDKIVKFMIFITRSPFKITFYWVYIIHGHSHYNLFKIFSKCIFSLFRPFVVIFDTYFPRIFCNGLSNGLSDCHYQLQLRVKRLCNNQCHK